MSRNLTLRIDGDLLVAAQHRAVDERKSLSAWVADLLRQTLRQDSALDKARQRALARLERGYALDGKPLTRAEVHER